jgi:predicted tellurium resistance membrane protein TerC
LWKTTITPRRPLPYRHRNDSVYDAQRTAGSMLDLEILLSLLTLTSLEIVLGIDNIVVIAIIAATLPVHQRDRARVVGLSLAMITRLMLLFSMVWIAGLTQPMFTVAGMDVSGRDLLMFGGGLFLMVKAVREIHEAMEEAGDPTIERRAKGFGSAIAQIVMLDVVFSFDSVITAVGMANQLWVMAAAIVVAVIVMLFASRGIIRFIHDHPTVKMLALAFVLLIGVALVADGMGFHIPKGYLYFAMFFSVVVEGLNVTMSKKRTKAVSKPRAHAQPVHVSHPHAGDARVAR